MTIVQIVLSGFDLETDKLLSVSTTIEENPIENLAFRQRQRRIYQENL